MTRMATEYERADHDRDVLIPISYLNECFRCDPGRGSLTWRVRPLSHFGDPRSCNSSNARLAFKEAGSVTCSGYRYVQFGGTGKYLKLHVHRIIWAMHTGAWPQTILDHANGDKLDNRISNLREATASQNAANRPATLKCRTGLKGVRRHGRKFRADIKRAGKITYLGLFETPELAHQAYSVAAIEQYGEFAGGLSL